MHKCHYASHVVVSPGGGRHEPGRISPSGIGCDQEPGRTAKELGANLDPTWLVKSLVGEVVDLNALPRTSRPQHSQQNTSLAALLQASRVLCPAPARRWALGLVMGWPLGFREKQPGTGAADRGTDPTPWCVWEQMGMRRGTGPGESLVAATKCLQKGGSARRAAGGLSMNRWWRTELPYLDRPIRPRPCEGCCSTGRSPSRLRTRRQKWRRDAPTANGEVQTAAWVPLRCTCQTPRSPLPPGGPS
jgi:hypothetical protein